MRQPHLSTSQISPHTVAAKNCATATTRHTLVWFSVVGIQTAPQTPGTDVCDLAYDMRMDETTSSFILRMHRQHMIEQEGNLDGLGMLDFMGFQKSCSILWLKH
jgi:hypothetical protein